jgi:ferredoxin
MGGDDIFWRALEKLGPPATDFQWCREILKKTTTFREPNNFLLRMVKLLQSIFRTRVIFIEGTRRREEPWRVILKKDVEIKSPMINATDIRPIVDFTDLDIWMYLQSRNIPIHPTYTAEKNQRMICLFCPDKTCEEMNRVRDNSPAQWDRFSSELERWRTIFGFPEQWTTKNLWMRDKPVSRYMQELGIASRIGMVRERLNSVVEVAESTMQDDGNTFAMRIKAPFEIGALRRWLRPFGKIIGGTNGQSFSVISNPSRMDVFENGEIRVVGVGAMCQSDPGKLLRQWMVSHLNCIGCGACTVNCSKIAIKDDKSHISRLCNGCAKCIEGVVAACPMNAIGIERCLVNKQDS